MRVPQSASRFRFAPKTRHKLIVRRELRMNDLDGYLLSSVSTNLLVSPNSYRLSPFQI
jgi:hypothetical protein